MQHPPAFSWAKIDSLLSVQAAVTEFYETETIDGSSSYTSDVDNKALVFMFQPLNDDLLVHGPSKKLAPQLFGSAAQIHRATTFSLHIVTVSGPFIALRRGCVIVTHINNYLFVILIEIMIETTSRTSICAMSYIMPTSISINSYFFIHNFIVTTTISINPIFFNSQHGSPAALTVYMASLCSASIFTVLYKRRADYPPPSLRLTQLDHVHENTFLVTPSLEGFFSSQLEQLTRTVIRDIYLWWHREMCFTTAAHNSPYIDDQN